MKRFGIACLVISCLFGLAVAWHFFTASLARRSLPWGATEIHEHYSDSGFPHYDFHRYLKARITETEFKAYAAKLNLSRIYSTEKHADLSPRWGSLDEPWWTPPASLDGAYFDHIDGDDYFAMAKYDNGYVYFVAMSW
ncbi:MAG: hypothetical protein WBF93_01410 [Pirellulales bacterium]